MQKNVEEITVFVHGKAEFDKAIETTHKLFTNQNASADSLSEEDLASIEGIVRSDYDSVKINAGIKTSLVFNGNSHFESKGAARKMLGMAV